MTGAANRPRRRLCKAALAISTVLALLPFEAALADEADEIIVTARKRSENLQDVPDTISAFGQEQIAERRLAAIDDFLGLTPNVRINRDQDAATNNISIRGLGANRNQAAAVAFAVDGVILPDGDAFTMDLSDAERVEVLKGPQGALYGRGAIAGAINVTTRRPTNDAEFEAKASLASGENVRVFGAASGPLVEDRLFARVTVSYLDKKGTVINAFDDRGLDHDRQTKISGRLIFEPSDALKIDFSTSYFDQTAGALYFNLTDVLGAGGGEITEAVAKNLPNMDGLNRSDRDIYMAALTIDLALGGGTLTSITAYDDINFHFSEDLDASPYALVPFAQQVRNTEGFSQELRFTSDGSQPFRYILGGYYQHSKREIQTRAGLDACLFASSCVTPDGVEPSGTVFSLELARNTITFDQYAVFAQASYDLSEALELTGALRYDHVDGRQDDLLAAASDKADFSSLQPKISLAFKPTPDQTFYATFARGFKSGNFNAVSSGAAFPRVVDAETSTNFEVGAKLRFMDRKVSLNAAAFLTDHRDPQIFQLDAATFTQGTLNANKVKIKGFEVDLQVKPVDALSLNIAFGYIDAEIRDFDGTTRYVGQRMPNAPEYTLNIGAQYAQPLGNDLEARLRLDFFGVGKQSFQDFQNPDPDAFLFQDSYGTFDGQISLAAKGWTATFFAKNIFDRRYATSAFSRWILPAAFVALNGDAVQPDPGRIVGGELRIKF